MKYALITGGSRGIGKAICLNLAKKGIPVLVNYQSNSSAAEEVKKIIEEEGGTAELLPFDVSDPQVVGDVLTEWESRHTDDYIAYLVNNAGIRRDNLLFMMPDDDWQAVLGTTLNGFYNVTQRLISKMMMRHHGGSIVNIASLSGLKGLPGQTNYSAAKAGLIGATKALAQEVAQRGVRVNAVAPGFIATDMTRDLPEKDLCQQVPMKRFGKPEEVADLVAFLLSEESSYITGEVININGGLYS